EWCDTSAGNVIPASAFGEARFFATLSPPVGRFPSACAPSERFIIELCISYRLVIAPTVTNVTFLLILGLILMLMKDSLQDAAAWFKLLDGEQQERVQRDVSITHYPAGAMIERKGEHAHAWLGVVSGLIKVSVGNSDGKVASLMGVPA